MSPPDGTGPVHWPGGAGSAAVMAFDLDGPTGRAMIDGSLWRRPVRFAQGGYGPFAALPRLLDTLARTSTRATFFTPAWVVEHWPAAVLGAAAAGHEIAHHGYQHERFLDLTPDQQAEVIDRSQEIFRSVLGRPATGFRTPTGDWSPETRGLLAARGFRYSSSLRDGHTPYRHVIDGRITDLVEIPARVDLDDYAHLAYFRDPDFPSGGDRIAGYRGVLASWHREIEGFRRVGGCLITTFHPQVIGTPGRARLVGELANSLHTAGDVWVTTAEDVAAHVLSTWEAR
jgi:peptidoglycan/xylan/chitin deacetylase (PgdA/CDA1 family)